MPDIEVRRLRLREPPDRFAGTAFLVEDALRTALPPDPRLVLVRRFGIASDLAALSPAARGATVRSSWLTAVAGACHGAIEGAEDRNCVWFESADEAAAALLSKLLAGRSANAWFWRLAVPRWQGRAPRPWLREEAEQAVAAGEGRGLLQLASVCVEQGAADLMLDALTNSSVRPVDGEVVFRLTEAEMPQAGVAPSAEEDDIPGTSAIRAALAKLAPELRNLLARADAEGGAAKKTVSILLRTLVLRLAPALALSPPLLAQVMARAPQWLNMRISAPRLPPSGTDAAGPNERRQMPRSFSADSVSRSAGMPAESSVRARRPAAAINQAEAAPARVPAGDATEAPPRPSAPPEQPSRSAHAGTYLLVPCLIDLGFRAWLADRPALLGGDPGRALLAAIARHHRADPEDPLFGDLPPPCEPVAPWHEQWRRMLDGFLRRRARRRVHQLVGRRGILVRGADRLDIRFPAEAADLALRRHALDRDPGWTDWLGLSIRFHFSGEEEWV